MKKIFKLFSLVFIILIIFILEPKRVNANSISEISMDIYIDENGNANVTEVWTCNAKEGTEVYHPYYNLGKSIITNLTVTDNGKVYSTLDEWKTSGTLRSKANKCGLNYISDGVEICWGISNYGKHVYKINYTITNFVSELSDSQMIYWTLIPHDLSNTVGRAYIKIHTFYSLPDATDIWGYGNYGGTCYVYNGIIEMESNGNLDYNEYMTILVKLPKGTFETNSIYGNNFNEIYNMAENGAKKYKTNNAMVTFFFVIWILQFPLAFIYILKGSKKNKQEKYYLNKSITIEPPYYRDIPFDGDLFRTYFIASKYDLIEKKTDLLGACILKWLKDEEVKIEKRIVGFLKKREETCVAFYREKSFENELENDLYNMMLDASKDGILERKELEKWCSNKYTKFLKWFDNVEKYEREKLIQESVLIQVSSSYSMKNEYSFTNKLDKEVEKLAGLKKYLKDYTLIEEKQPIEVKLFEEYLIYAQILGIAKQVAKEFKELYPQLVNESNLNYEDILFIQAVSSRGIRSAETAREIARSRANRYNSGGGGYSSGGGRRRFVRWRRRPAGGFR